MGWFTGNLKKLIEGKTIKEVEQIGGMIWMPTRIFFTDGTHLHLRPTIEPKQKSCGCMEEAPAIIAVLYNEEGEPII